jgi:hypothetical protein
MSKATIVCVCFLAACATGGNSGGNDEPADAAVTVQRDANNVVTPDAPRSDAGVQPQDAAVSQLPDASTGGGGPFCATNSNCTVAGECCVNLGGPQGFCAPGTVVLGQCFPE